MVSPPFCSLADRPLVNFVDYRGDFVESWDDPEITIAEKKREKERKSFRDAVTRCNNRVGGTILRILFLGGLVRETCLEFCYRNLYCSRFVRVFVKTDVAGILWEGLVFSFSFLSFCWKY